MSNASEDDDLEFTKGLRKNMINALAPGGVVPNDPKTIAVLSGLLRDMDHSALTQKRIKVDKKVADNEAVAAALMLQLLSAPTDKLPIMGSTIEGTGRVPSVPKGLVEYTPSEGEMREGLVSEDYHTFMNRTKDLFVKKKPGDPGE